VTTHELRRRLHVLDELGVWRVLMGETASDPVQACALFFPPWRDRLADGRLGPFYGTTLPSTWQVAWTAWNQSRAGGGLWDPATDEETRRGGRPKPPPQPPAPEFLRMDAFLARYGHRLTQRELEVATMRCRGRMRPATIAKRLGMKQADVEALLRGVFQMWMQANLGRTAS
jgi:DNA-binding CsgD family transcriptional regulator